MTRALAIIAALVATGCNGSSGGSDGPDATCVPQNGVYDCLGGSWPVCPASAQPEQACDNTLPTCMGCTNGGSMVGSGYACSCQDAGLVPQQHEPLWACIGTEYSCR